MIHEAIMETTETVGRQVIDAALAVHRLLGPGLLESAYEHCLAKELEQRSLRVDRQLALPVVYRGFTLEAGYRVDLLVAKSVVVEVKAVEALTPVHDSQLLTYLKLSGHRLGFLINFNVPLIKQGIRRKVV